jgi:hypothetical protein
VELFNGFDTPTAFFQQLFVRTASAYLKFEAKRKTIGSMKEKRSL